MRQSIFIAFTLALALALFSACSDESMAPQGVEGAGKKAPDPYPDGFVPDFSAYFQSLKQEFFPVQNLGSVGETGKRTIDLRESALQNRFNWPAAARMEYLVGTTTVVFSLARKP